MIVAGTGHRPSRLGGYDERTLTRLTDLAEAGLEANGAALVISGMALGWDTAIARAALRLGIPFDAYVPFLGQESLWPQKSQLEYGQLLLRANRVLVISPDGYSARAMQRRNEVMVDACDLLLALWDGSAGGTSNCMRYAREKNRVSRNLWSSWSKYAQGRHHD